jgi:hypothetical protein
MDDICKRDTFSDEGGIEVPLLNALILDRGPRSVDQVGGCRTNVPHLVVHHSPDGFEWGYAGSGPADLALNACQLYLNIIGYSGRKTKCYDGSCWTLAWFLHQDFKRAFIAGAPREGAVIPFEKMDAWFQLHMTDELLGQCRDYESEEDER